MVGVGSIRTPVTSPSNSRVSSTTASPWIVRACSSGGSQYAAPDDDRPGLVADQRNPLRLAGAGPARVPWSAHVADLHIEPVRPQQPGQYRREIGVRSHDDDPAAVGDVVEADHRQITQRAGHSTAAEQQHHNIAVFFGMLLTSAVRQRGSSRSAGIGWVTGCTQLGQIKRENMPCRQSCSSAPNGATRAKERPPICSVAACSGSCATRAATTPATPWCCRRARTSRFT